MRGRAFTGSVVVTTRQGSAASMSFTSSRIQGSSSTTSTVGRASFVVSRHETPSATRRARGLLQVLLDLPRALVAHGHRLGRGLAHHVRHRLRHRAVRARELGQGLGEVAEEHVHEAVRVEGRAALDHLEEHAAEGVEVAALVRLVAARPLGRHVVRGAQDEAALGHG